MSEEARIKRVRDVCLFAVDVEMQGTACYRILESGSKRIAKILKTEFNGGLNILLANLKHEKRVAILARPA